MSGSLPQPRVAAILRDLGWRVRTTGEYRQAVRSFQHGWAIGPPLSTDGKVGPLTSAALRRSAAALNGGKPTASLHFSFDEFACKCGGRYDRCTRIWVARHLILGLESLRRHAYPHGLTVVSGCRCTDHNRAVGGARSSQHLYGYAADIDPVVPAANLARWRLFAGLGVDAAGRVRHVDLRNESGHNLTGASLARPTRWAYSR